MFSESSILNLFIKMAKRIIVGVCGLKKRYYRFLRARLGCISLKVGQGAASSAPTEMRRLQGWAGAAGLSNVCIESL